jgi:D-alanyl-D-alanine carboxypeptidase/D-alanyl-D-alanine-endopeptidase (penicillin-binding protein 4)
MSEFVANWQYRFLLSAIASLTTLAIYLSDRNSAQAQINPSQTDRVCASQLESEIDKIALTPKLKSLRLGVLVTALATSSQALVNVDGDKYFIPASNAKLIVTAAALRLLGANYRIRTSLVARQAVSPNGEIRDGLGVVGSGDPSFTTDSLKLLVKQLVQKGVKHVRGGIYGVPQFRDSGLGVGWEWQDLQEYYAAIAHPLTINQNALDWTIKPTKVGQPVNFSWDNPDLTSGWIVENKAQSTTKGNPYTLKVERPFNSQKLIISGQIPLDSEPELGATAVPEPSAHFLKLLTAELIVQGIQIDPTPKTSTAVTPKSSSVELASVESPTIAELIRTTNKDSHNLYAELLLRQIGHRFSQPHQDASESGIEAIATFLQKQGISTDSFNLADAAGLSRRNAITPRALTRILQVMGHDPVFRDSLPIAAIDGTLKNRFQNTPASGNLRAKTGTLSDTVSLSGYAKPAMYDELVFSIMLNHSNLEAKDAREFVDAIALLLMRLQRC